jgi:uncharacterized lipoprotein YmbA
MRIYYAAIVLCLSLVACASAPTPIKYYRISSAPEQKTPTPETTQARRVVLEAVEMPAFLRQPGLVMQSSTHQITVSKDHLWAERLDKAVPRLLATKLQALSDDYVFYLDGDDWVDQADFRFRLRIDNLQATTTGEAITSGAFQLADVVSGETSTPQDFSFASDLQRDGYAESVVQLEYLIGQIATSMLEALRKQKKAPELDAF